MKRSGFTMIELMIAFTIMAIMAVIMIAIFNPMALSNRGYDARRKKDVRNIGIAFEEYFNDKGEYPTGVESFACGSQDFSPWLNSWPCDPTGVRYEILTAPQSYKIMTNLLNKKDKDIPAGWYSLPPESFIVGDGSLTVNDVNYGVSSPNVSWYEVNGSFVPSVTPTFTP